MSEDMELQVGRLDEIRPPSNSNVLRDALLVVFLVAALIGSFAIGYEIGKDDCQCNSGCCYSAPC